tara:strand:- start:674 stop:1483 length:810 start_codon:yes stop_codon:yes gene_type:complete
MNLGTIVGLVLGFILLGYASIEAAGDAGLGALWDLVSFLIVVGGAISATAIAFKFNDVVAVIGQFSRTLKDDNFTLKDIVMDFVGLAESARKGPQDLGKALESPPDHMSFRLGIITNGCQYIVDGMSKEDITEILENMEEYRAIREERKAMVMKTLGLYAPAFGMIGTLIGLVFMLGGMANPPEGVNMSAFLGAKMAVALITTLYGALFANFFFIPFADKLLGISEGKKIESSLVLAGVLLLHERAHPLMVRDKLNAFLERKDRILDEE